jgi:hypothetical protein
LGDTQVFTEAKDVTPAIVVLSKPSIATKTDSQIRTIRLRKSDDPAQINELVARAGWDVPLSQLSMEGWEFDEPSISKLRKKLRGHAKLLTDYVAGRFFRGLITGLNEAFVINTATKNSFVSDCASCAAILKPFVGGQDLRRWYHEDSDRWLILFPNGATSAAITTQSEDAGWSWLSENYPPIADHLAHYATKGRRRLDQGQFWWELRACDYYDAFERPKIMYPDIAKTYRFHIDAGGLYASNTTYFLPVGNWYLLGVLNSKAT